LVLRGDILGGGLLREEAEKGNKGAAKEGQKQMRRKSASPWCLCGENLITEGGTDEELSNSG